MQALVWVMPVLMVFAGLMMMRCPRTRRLRDRADGEQLGVRISNAIEQIRRGR